MANNKAKLNRNVGTKDAPVWEQWSPYTVADAVLMSEGNTKTINQYVDEKAATKVDKVSGKQLSTEDYTTADKTKLNGIAPGAQVNVIETVKVNGTAITPSSKAVNIDLSGYAQKSDITAVYKVKGSKASYSALPSTGNVTGDVWNVEDTGANYVWTGTEWDKLSETVDLSGYATKEDLNGKVDKVNGKQLSTNDYTTAEKNKLAGLNNYVHPDGDGSKHVPATGTTNNGKLLQAGATAGALQWVAPSKTLVGLGNVDNTSDANKPVSTAQQIALDKKVDKVSGKQLSTEDYTTAEKTKLSGLSNYVHPEKHPATMITEDASHRFTTDAEKAAWNAKVDVIFANELPSSAPAGTLCFLIS